MLLCSGDYELIQQGFSKREYETMVAALADIKQDDIVPGTTAQGVWMVAAPTNKYCT